MYPVTLSLSPPTTFSYDQLSALILVFRNTQLFFFFSFFSEFDEIAGLAYINKAL